MTEQLQKKYQVLFQIHLLHHYWLDDGGTVFDLIPTQAKRDGRLLSYDRRGFIEMAPTRPTAELLKGIGAIYKDSALGCIVAVPKETVLDAGAILEFALAVRDPSFHNYTALTLRPQKIYEIYYQPEDTIYRYKENVPLLSNATGVTRQFGANKVLFLSAEFPALAADDQVESLVLSGGGLSQLTADQPGATLQQVNGAAGDLPVFIHQGDVPLIAPPPGLTGAPARGIRLTPDIPDGVFALLRLDPFRSGDLAFVDNGGRPKDTPPVFEVRFKNRSTIWKYFNKNTGLFDSAEPQPLPLTSFGNAGSKQKPSEGFVKAVKAGGRITQLVSEIFI